MSLANLKQTIWKNDSNFVRELLLKNPELLDHSDAGYFKYLIFSYVARTADKNGSIELLNFFNFEDNVKKLIIAILKGNVNVTESLLKNGVRLGGSGWHEEYLPTMFRSVFRRTKTSKDMLILFVKYGVNINCRNRRSKNILLQFILDSKKNKNHDSMEIIEILIDAGVSFEETGDYGFPPLYYAIHRKNTDLVRFLVKKGADVNKTHRYEETPLMWAVMFDTLDIVDLLISSGANVNTKNNIGWTPLHKACYCCYEDVVSLLVRRGADVSVKDNYGRTPLCLFFLHSDINNNKRCIKIVVKALTKLVFENHTVSEKDINLIQSQPWLQEYVEKCKNELEQMAETKFYGPHSYYSLLKIYKNVKKLAKLTENEIFLTKFKENLNQFRCYEEDLQTVLEEAVKVRDKTREVYSNLCSVFGKFFPDVVIRKLTDAVIYNDLTMQ